jgi:hypothetical protein
MDGRELIPKACRALNESKLLLDDISVDGIETATKKDLQMIVNKFLDDIEMIPESKEHLIPDIVLNTYNGIVDGTVVFSTIDSIPTELKQITFQRTKFPKRK